MGLGEPGGLELRAMHHRDRSVAEGERSGTLVAGRIGDRGRLVGEGPRQHVEHTRGSGPAGAEPIAQQPVLGRGQPGGEARQRSRGSGWGNGGDGATGETRDRRHRGGVLLDGRPSQPVEQEHHHRTGARDDVGYQPGGSDRVASGRLAGVRRCRSFGTAGADHRPETGRQLGHRAVAVRRADRFGECAHWRTIPGAPRSAKCTAAELRRRPAGVPRWHRDDQRVHVPLRPYAPATTVIEGPAREGPA